MSGKVQSEIICVDYSAYIAHPQYDQLSLVTENRSLCQLPSATGRKQWRAVVEEMSFL